MTKKTSIFAVFVVIFVAMTTVVFSSGSLSNSKETIVEEITTATVVTTTETASKVRETTTKKPSQVQKTTECKQETTVKSKSEKAKKYTDDDLYYLAATVYREAGNSSEEVQLLVANVVINRVNSSLYPDTIYKVLTQYRQYGTMWKYGVSFPSGTSQKAVDHCRDIARRILEGERVCPENVLFQAEFKQGSGVYKEVDGIYFCYYGK